MEGTGDNLILLFFCQLMEIYRISGYSHGKLWVFFRMLLRVQQRFAVQNVYVQMMSAFFRIAVK